MSGHDLRAFFCPRGFASLSSVVEFTEILARMPPIKEIPRSAYVAWSPTEAYKTVVALGGRGVNAHLDLVDTKLGDLNRGAYEVRRYMSIKEMSTMLVILVCHGIVTLSHLSVILGCCVY